MTAPLSHNQDALRLTGDGRVHLYELTLHNSSTVVRFKNNDTVTWRGNVYEGLPCQLSGEMYTADDEESRPTLRVNNPLGIFNNPALDGLLYRAILVRKVVLLQHIESNANIFRQSMWYVERPKELVPGVYVSLDLRNMSEGPNFKLPVRKYIPPDFPMVSF